MEFLLLFNDREGTPPPVPADMAPMTRYSNELRDRGVLRRGAPLGRGAEAARVRVQDGEALVTDGPFPETKEMVAGFWIVDVPDREAALEIARKVPHLGRGPVEVHALPRRFSYRDLEKGRPFFLAFRMEPGLVDADGSKYARMIAWAEARSRDGTVFEIARLGDEPPAARLEMQDGKPLVKDGPFAETKDALGGYSLVRARDRAAAVEIAKQYPHATWGPVEVREILFFDPVSIRS